MIKPRQKVFIIVDRKVVQGTVVAISYSGYGSLEWAMVNVDGTVHRVERHDKLICFPEVGMGATAGYGGDCYPYTIVSVSKSGRQIEVQRDEAKYNGPQRGFGDNGKAEDWEFTPIPDSHKYTVKLNKNGQWKGVGGFCTIGHRMYRQDPHF